MDAMIFISKIEAAGFALAVIGDTLSVSPASRLTDPQRAFIRAHKPALLAALTRKTDPEPIATGAAQHQDEPDPDDVLEFALERAAIAEFDGGLSMQEAERLAIERAALHFKLAETYGDPPTQGGGHIVGGEGDTVEDLERELRARYGARLAGVEHD